MKRWMILVMMALTFIALVIVIAPVVSAQLVYTQNSEFNLKVPCEFNGTYCSVSAVCNLTYIDPVTTTLVDNALMTNQFAYHNYTINVTQSALTGIHTATVVCDDQGFSGLNTFEVLITPNGEIPSTSKSIVDLAMLFGLIIMLAFSIFGIFYVKDVRGKLALYWITHLLAISISFIAWQTASGILSYSPYVGAFFRIIFYFLIIAFLPMFFITIGYVIKFHFINKNVMDLINAGYEKEDAERIALRMAKDE